MDPRSTSTNALFDPMKPLLPFHDPLERFIYAIGMARGLTDASQAPEIQTMYNLPMPVSTIRTRIRQEFERHRYVNKLPVTDVLLFKSHAEYQEMMNFWKQTTHVLSYFKDENFRGDKRLPSSFMSGFLEGRN
ncbi:ndufa6 NADH-ubiquinone oxidoreductase subunit [Amphichorda felina]